jgi:hypothetical protein
MQGRGDAGTQDAGTQDAGTQDAGTQDLQPQSDVSTSRTTALDSAPSRTTRHSPVRS